MVFDDLGLDDEMLAKVQAAHDADVKGLKAKNSDLIEQNKAIKADSEKAALEAAQIAEDAKVALAEKEGNIEQYKAAVAERDEKMKSIEQEFIEKDKARVLDMAVTQFISDKVDKDPAARKYMESVYRDQLDVVNGELVSKDVTKSVKEITQAIVQDDAHSKYIVSGVGSGAGAAGSNSTNGQAKSLSEMTATEESQFAKLNPEQYAQMTQQ